MIENITKYWLVLQKAGDGNPFPLKARELDEALREAENLQTIEQGWAAIYDVPDHREHRPALATRQVIDAAFDQWVLGK
ncbi:hypothetical protein C4J81_11120 [Deltaproteobacteria bacterium Smac51]|nr:hypothetical protein C4J81_11120 [Deltaproteobacteria bacterium Smac51]